MGQNKENISKNDYNCEFPRGNSVSRGYLKIHHALHVLNINVKGKVCADFGASTGGFVQCLLDHGAERVYAIETGYGVLDWTLRNNPQVVVMERTNVLRTTLPQAVDIVTIDTSWTKQSQVIHKALEFLKPHGVVISLIKPHYEAEEKWLNKGKLSSDKIKEVVDNVRIKLEEDFKDSFRIHSIIESPVTGLKGGNVEFLLFGAKL